MAAASAGAFQPDSRGDQGSSMLPPGMSQQSLEQPSPHPDINRRSMPITAAPYSQEPRTTNPPPRSFSNDETTGSSFLSNSYSSGQDRAGRDQEQSSSSSGRERSRGGSRRPSGSRVCGKCGGGLTGQFVRALDNTWHLNCFTCHDCGKVVASKFFPVPDQPPGQYPLCETDYFRRLDLLCYACGGALRGSYITALNRKYHIEHFTCSVCPTVFGASDSYYEHNDAVYCHYHYSTKFAQRCNGCQTAILKQFVEIFRNGQNQHWHPECYMIHKYWNVRLRGPDEPSEQQPSYEQNATEEARHFVKQQEDAVEERVLWIWRTLSTFEERSATTISDMLLHVSGGAYYDGVMAARKFITHVELLFGAAEDLDRLLSTKTSKGLVYTREAKLLCKKIVAFFALLSQSRGTGVRKLGVTQELLSLVTGLAHYLKLVIRICLQGSLRLEREASNAEGLSNFLNEINSLDARIEQDSMADVNVDTSLYVPASADTCPICNGVVEDKCIRKRNRVFHINCMICQNCGTDFNTSPQDAKWSQSKQKLLCKECGRNFPDAESGFVQVTKMSQYTYLLKVAHARLLNTLQSSGALPHTSDNPNLMDYDSSQGHRLSQSGEELGPPGVLRSNTRSKSYTGAPPQDNGQQSSYEQTLGDIRRLKSTRLDRHLSNAMKTARTSRIIDGPEGTTPGSTGEETTGRQRTMSIIQDRTVNGESQSILGFNNSLALDDIPRMLAAEQAKEQRPNASKYARDKLIGSEPKPRMVNGHRRDLSGGADDPDRIAVGEGRAKEYFSQLSPLEYFAVRHVAVVLLGQELDGQYNQEELLDLIETRKRTFWGDVAKAFGGGKPKPAEKSKGQGKNKGKGVFGRSLEQAIERDWHETEGVGLDVQLKVPALIHDTIAAMKNMDMSVEGVFRKNGNIKRLKETAEEIDREGCNAVNLNKDSPVQVASLLKKYLRDLPDPVLTFKLHPLFISAAKITDDAKRKRVLHLLCCILPKTHRDTMEVIFEFLTWCSSFHTVDEETGSKMDIHNLATVIAPNILYSASKAPDMDASFLAIEAVHTLIEGNSEFAEIPEDIQSILSDPSLFANQSQEVTTKEILKRWNEISQNKSSGPSPHPSASPNTDRSRQGSRPSAPQVTRVDASSPNVWQNESSVRHVGGPGNGYGPSNGQQPQQQPPLQQQQQQQLQQQAPPQNQGDADYANPNIPFANPRSSSESQRRGNNDSPRQNGFRSSAYARQSPLGVT